MAAKKKKKTTTVPLLEAVGINMSAPQRSPVMRKKAMERKKAMAAKDLAPVKLPEPKTDPVDEAMVKTRAGVKSLLTLALGDYSQKDVRLFCALVLQELGESEAAAVLIKKHDLPIKD